MIETFQGFFSNMGRNNVSWQQAKKINLNNSWVGIRFVGATWVGITFVGAHGSE